MVLICILHKRDFGDMGLLEMGWQADKTSRRRPKLRCVCVCESIYIHSPETWCGFIVRRILHFGAAAGALITFLCTTILVTILLFQEWRHNSMATWHTKTFRCNCTDRWECGNLRTGTCRSKKQVHIYRICSLRTGHQSIGNSYGIADDSQELSRQKGNGNGTIPNN